MTEIDKSRKYNCSDCGKIDGSLYWSNYEKQMVVKCSKCGKVLQNYDETMYVTSIPRCKN